MILKVKLLQNARIAHKAGDIVDVSPAEGAFLISVDAAEEIVEKATAPIVETAEKAVEVKKPVSTVKKAPAKKATSKRGK